MNGEELGPVQQAFLEEDAFQCGYCTPGQIMAVEGLLRSSPDPSPDHIRAAMSGNLCRCGAYTHIFKAAKRAAELKRKAGGAYERRNPSSQAQLQNPWNKTNIIGKRVPRVDAYERVSGSAVYPSDVVFPDMLYGAILRCPWPNAKVRSVDTSEAEKMEGVYAVISRRSPRPTSTGRTPKRSA